MANAWVQVDQIASEALMHLEDRLVVTRLAARDKTSEWNKTPDGYSKGSSVRIKMRPDYEAKEFSSSVVVQEIRESSRQMTIEKHFDVSVVLTAKEKALDFESFTEQVIRPAAYRLAEKCEAYVASKLLNGSGLYASDDLFTDAADMAQAKKYANFQQLSPEGRFCLVNDTLEAKLLGKQYFNTYNNRGEDGSRVFREGSMGHAMGMDFHSSLHLPSWQITPGLGAAQTNNASGTKNKIGDKVLTVDSVDLSTNTIKAGDRIYVAGTRRPMRVAELANGATTTEIKLVDPISEIIPDDAAVTVVGTTKSNVTFMGAILDSESLAVAMPLLDLPSDKRAFILSNNGFSIRVVTGYDMSTKTEMMSLDCLIGAEAWDPRRITLLAEY